MKKRGAMELSISTIVVIVIALTMLILGLVLVRTIMCGAVGLTSDLNSRVKGEVNKLFEATGGEVQCVGNSGEAVTITPGKANIIYCGIRATTSGSYDISLKEIRSTGGEVSSAELRRWLNGEESWRGTVAPGDELPKKILRLDVPENAPEVGIIVQIEAKKDGSIISTQDLDFKISRQGLIKAAVC